MKTYLVILLLGTILLSCDTSENVEENQTVEKATVSDLSFDGYYQKISYAIGLDHGTAGKAIYEDEKLTGKFDVAEIRNGLVDYLSSNPLKIIPNTADSILELYLVKDGNVDSSAVSQEIGSYAIGVNEAIVLVSSFVARGIDQDINAALLIKGINDGLDGIETSYELEDAQVDIASFYAGVNLKNEQDFFANNGKKSGVMATTSGLQYQIFESGMGPRPNSSDSVVVHYTGRFINGQEFDSSIPSGYPARVSLLNMIKGWSEGVALMNKGAKFRLFIPSKLAYGEKGRDYIEANTPLVFDVELIDIISYVPNY